MSTPGFTAEHSLYRTGRNYCLSAAHHQADGATLQELPSQILSGALPIGPFPHWLCQPCVVDPISGACAKQCVFCPGPVPDERCTPVRLPCPEGCCPPGQEPCY